MTDWESQLNEHKERGGTNASFLRQLRGYPSERERALREVTKADLDLSELEGE